MLPLLFSSIFLASTVVGQIIYSGDLTATVGHEGVDLNGDGEANLRLNWVFLTTTDIPPSAQRSSLEVTPLPGSSILRKEGRAGLSEGTLIGANSSEATWEALGRHSVTWFQTPGSEKWSGPVGDEGVGYVGFRFESEHGMRYGWLRVRSIENALNPTGGLFWPIPDSWAYQAEPGVPIVAGAIPEPAHVAALIGLAALTMVIMRRRSVMWISN